MRRQPTPEQKAGQTLACYRCGKPIARGKRYVSTSPSILEIQLGTDFPKSYHTICYGAVEREAAREIAEIRGRA